MGFIYDIQSMNKYRKSKNKSIAQLYIYFRSYLNHNTRD